jgi:hypothetical protein
MTAQTDETVNYMSLEEPLRDSMRLASPLLEMHADIAQYRSDDPETEQRFRVMEVLLDRLKVDTTRAVEIWEATFNTAPDTVVKLKPRKL